MDAGYVILSVLVALLSVWGALSICRGLLSWFFAPPQIRGCVILRDAAELENLDFLLTEAEKNFNYRRGVPLAVIVTPELARFFGSASGSARRVTLLGGEMTPEACLEKHGAIMIITQSIP